MLWQSRLVIISNLVGALTWQILALQMMFLVILAIWYGTLTLQKLVLE